jgi:hypothetical protein
VSIHQSDDGFNITVKLTVPEKTIHPAEFRPIAAHLGELLQQVIREADTEE